MITAEKKLSATTIGKYRWTICSLVFFATTVNYLDRQVMSLLKPTLEKEFNWSESDYSNIVAAFQFAYAIGMLGAGRTIDKIGTKLGYAITLVLWSIASILHAFATGVLSFSVCRAFLGITEAGNFPAAIKTIAEWFPKKERALASGYFNSGTNVGAILAPLLVPYIALHYGWQVSFIAIGAIGFVWLFFWFKLYEVPFKSKRLSKAEYDYINSDAEVSSAMTDQEQHKISWVQLLRFRQTWSFVVGKFLTDGIWWFLLFWLPAFLNAQYKLEGMQVSLPIAFVYTLAGFASIFGGWLPMWFLKRGWNIVAARKTAMLIAAFFPLLIIFSQAAGSLHMWYAIIIIAIAASAHQAWSANLYTTVSDMFPKSSVASVVGIGGMAGALGGIGIAKVAGKLFDYYKALGQLETGYYFMFIYCGLGYLLAWLIIFKLLVPTMQPVSISGNNE